MDESAVVTTSEFVSRYVGLKPNNVLSGLEFFRTHGVGELMLDAEDGTSKEAVTPVKKQKRYGSCC